ncbi:MAG: hypothetical protein HYS52_01615 [Candidatus Wildermuthbacteria bacterium]|nr:hypothetical protein [Candidatus Wildermuthbacteria bacterium]
MNAAHSILLFFLFYLLVLFQVGFVSHFSLFGFIPNSILIAYILLVIFESRFPFSFAGAFVAGFFLDLFSQNLLGISVVMLLALRALLKLAMQYYVRLPLLFQR